jgi:hypothetical protein
MPALGPKSRWHVVVGLLALGALGCAASAAEGSLLPRELPLEARERHAVLERLGAQLYGALGGGTLPRVLADGPAYAGAVRERSGVPHELRLRTVPEVSAEDRALWNLGRYAGVCAQSGRLELKSSVLGLRHSGFVVERLLLVGREPAGGRVAGWVEGAFVLTGRGFIALSIERAESPRRDHADLELAECELWAGPPPTQDVVADRPLSH